MVPRGSLTPVLHDTLVGLTSVFGMGTGVSLPLWPPSCRLSELNRDSLSLCDRRETPVSVWFDTNRVNRAIQIPPELMRVVARQRQ